MDGGRGRKEERQGQPCVECTMGGPVEQSVVAVHVVHVLSSYHRARSLSCPHHQQLSTFSPPFLWLPVSAVAGFAVTGALCVEIGMRVWG